MSAWLDTDPKDYGAQPPPPKPLSDIQAATGTEGDGLFNIHDL
ncbi:hypothetical protein [Nonomuraea sp. NPDC052265]